MPVYGVRANVGPAPQGAKIDMVAPGSRGLNLETQNQVTQDYSYATEAQNAVLDVAGRLGARSLFVNQTTTPITGAATVRTLFEHRRSSGAVDTIVAWDGGLSTSVSNPQGSDVSGAVVDTNGRWKFVNFVDKCIGFQAGQTMIIRPSAGGNFVNVAVSSGTAPTGGVGTAAYGRIWQVNSDGHTISYCKLLDETAWSGTGSGQIDMSSIWTDGTDVITAIAAFDNNLVVFGMRHIVLFSDGGAAGVLGLDPNNLQVSGMITGTGCVSQHTVATIGDSDLFFLSPTGVQSLRRLLINRSNPLDQVTKYVRSALILQIASEADATQITGMYSPNSNFYLLAMPSNGVVWCLDTKRRYTDQFGDDCCVVTRWDQTLHAMYETVGRLLYVSRTAGKIAGYGFGPDASEELTARYIWWSPWMDFGQYQIGDRIKLLKRLGGQFFVESTTGVIFKWWTDFAHDTDFKTVTVTASGADGAEYGLAEYDIAEYGAGLEQATLVYDARADGQYYRIGFEADVSGTFSVQQAYLFCKVGRMQA